MKITIDNLDGLGAVDYTQAMSAAKGLRIERLLNEPSLCTFTVLGVAMPVRNARVRVSSDEGVTLFTGYLPCEPTMEYAGVTGSGAVYAATIAAVSDEILLDQQPVPQTSTTYGQKAADILEQLTERVDATRFTASTGATSTQIGAFAAVAGESWSRNAGALASMGRAAYRVVDGTLILTPVASVVHALNEADGSLKVESLKTAAVKMLANDVTLCGEREPAAYVTEIFQADGIVSSFEVTEEPFFPSSATRSLISDLFQDGAVNRQLWQVSDPDVQISMSSAGLTYAGGTGLDGQTNLSSIDWLELGGSLTATATGVQLGASGDGILCGLYGGSTVAANCFAGFHVKQSGGSQQMVPLILGSEAGATFAPVAGHMYTLRIRVYVREMQRVMASYLAAAGSGASCFGGDCLPCSANVVLEIQDATGGINGVTTVLYAGMVASSPATCALVPVNTATLSGSIRSVEVQQHGSVWATSLMPDGTSEVLRLGTPAEDADCKVTRTGRLEFYSGRKPAANEKISVCYRNGRRSVARLANAASQAAEGNAEIPATSRWIGSIRRPAARSSADCENAAEAVLAMSVSRLAASQGEYIDFNLQAQADVWPGDVLAIESASAGVDGSVVVRTVKIEVDGCVPEMMKYTIGFANDWAHDLAMQLSPEVPTDVWLPDRPVTAVSVLASLSALRVASVSGVAIAVDAGNDAPSDGGFEVRTTDWSFGPGADSCMVLRSAVRNFSIPRVSAMEQYYVRMYDGATPPNYSRFSAALFVNVPLS